MFTIRFLAFGVCIALMTNGVDAAIIIEQWNMVTGVRNSSGQQFAFAETVQNPFFTTHDIVRGASSARTDFNFSWTDFAGGFLIQGSQHAADTDSSLLTTISESRITLHTDQDFLFTYDMACDYDLPIDSVQVVCSLGVVNNSPPYDAYVDAYVVDDTYSEWPASGTYHHMGQVVLPAGNEYNIAYLMRLAVHGPPSPGFATVDGYVHFTLQDVPEPATLLLLGFGAILLRGSRR